MRDGSAGEGAQERPAPTSRADDSLVWAPLLLLASLAWLVLSYPLACRSSNPPVFHNEWVWGMLASLGLLLLAVFSSARSQRAAVRGMYGAAAVCALLSLAQPALGFWVNYDRLPWEAMVPVGSGVAIAAWKGRRQWLSAAVVVTAVMLAVGTRFA